MPRLAIECPLCGDRHTERLALAWAKGLSRTESTAAGVGATLMAPFHAVLGAASPLSLAFWPFLLLKSFLGFGLFMAKSWGTSQSVYSRETRPPYRFPTLKAILVFPVAWVALLAIMLLALSIACELSGLGREGFERHAGLAVAASLAACAAVVCLGVFYNRAVWPKREALWQRSFACKRCGAIFPVPEYHPEGGNAVRSDRAGEGGLLPLAGNPEDRLRAAALAPEDERRLRKRKPGWR